MCDDPVFGTDAPCQDELIENFSCGVPRIQKIGCFTRGGNRFIRNDHSATSILRIRFMRLDVEIEIVLSNAWAAYQFRDSSKLT